MSVLFDSLTSMLFLAYRVHSLSPRGVGDPSSLHSACARTMHFLELYQCQRGKDAFEILIPVWHTLDRREILRVKDKLWRAGGWFLCLSRGVLIQRASVKKCVNRVISYERANTIIYLGRVTVEIRENQSIFLQHDRWSTSLIRVYASISQFNLNVNNTYNILQLGYRPSKWSTA